MCSRYKTHLQISESDKRTKLRIPSKTSEYSKVSWHFYSPFCDSGWWPSTLAIGSALWLVFLYTPSVHWRKSFLWSTILHWPRVCCHAVLYSMQFPVFMRIDIFWTPEWLRDCVCVMNSTLWHNVIFFFFTFYCTKWYHLIVHL